MTSTNLFLENNRACFNQGIINRNYIRDATVTTGSETERPLPANKILEDAALACALATHNGDLRKIKRQWYSQRSENILKLVYNWNQLLHAHVPGHLGDYL